MADSSGSYVLTGLTGFPVLREAAPNSTVTYNLVGVTDTFSIQSDAASTTSVNQLVSVADTLDLTAAGGTILLSTGISGIDTIASTVTRGGTVVIGGTLANLLSNSSFTYGPGGGTIVLGSTGSFVSLSCSGPINGFVSSLDVIDNRALSYGAITGYAVSGAGSGLQTVAISAGSETFRFVTNRAGLTNGSFTRSNLNAGTLRFARDTNDGTLISVCFLRGTRIATSEGEVAVEDLQPGSSVSVLREGRVGQEKLVWVGSSHVTAEQTASDDSAYAVRVRAGAFAHGVPTRDLLLTPEHCILAEGGLIPIRMLVNGASILIDRTLAAYEYFHLELARHGIVLAEGLTTETYLDMGNRGLFEGTGSGAAAQARLELAAPLTVQREIVEPLWNRLLERAEALGFQRPDYAAKLTDQPWIRLLLDDGRTLLPDRLSRDRHLFRIPQGRRPIRLLSRSARPSDVIGPFVDDRRRLGVAVGSMILRIGTTQEILPIEALSLPGWHGREPQQRWTNGSAALDLPVATDETSLELAIRGSLLYPVEPGVAARGGF